MRYGTDRKEDSRRQIVELASERLRRDGIAGVGLRTIMTDAGLTHGAFYAHFESRTELVAEALRFALDQTRERLERVAARAEPDDRLRAFVTFYLRQDHRARAGTGCATAALAPEIARLDPSIQRIFAEGLTALAGSVAGFLPEGGTPDERLSRGLAILAGLMGTLQLARALPDGSPSDALLESGRASAIAGATAPWPSCR